MTHLLRAISLSVCLVAPGGAAIAQDSTIDRLVSQLAQINVSADAATLSALTDQQLAELSTILSNPLNDQNQKREDAQAFLENAQ
ncbi:MAG: hypothetical protein AAGJ28_17025 [Pseudomonadota bacterium]